MEMINNSIILYFVNLSSQYSRIMKSELPSKQNASTCSIILTMIICGSLSWKDWVSGKLVILNSWVKIVEKERIFVISGQC